MNIDLIKSVVADANAKIRGGAGVEGKSSDVVIRYWKRVRASEVEDAVKYLRFYTAEKNGSKLGQSVKDLPIEKTTLEGFWRCGEITRKREDDETYTIFQELKKGFVQTVKSGSNFVFSEFLTEDGHLWHSGASTPVLKLPNVDPAKVEAIRAELQAADTFSNPKTKYETMTGTYYYIDTKPKPEDDGSFSIFLFLSKHNNSDLYFKFQASPDVIKGFFYKWEATETTLATLIDDTLFDAQGKISTDYTDTTETTKVPVLGALWHQTGTGIYYECILASGTTTAFVGNPTIWQANTLNTLQDSVSGRTVQMRRTSRDPEDRLFDVEIEITWSAEYLLSDAASAITFQKFSGASVTVDQGFNIPDNLLPTYSAHYKAVADGGTLAENQLGNFQFERDQDNGTFRYTASIITLTAKQGYIDCGDKWIFFGGQVSSTTPIEVPTAIDALGFLTLGQLKTLSGFKVDGSLSFSTETGLTAYNLQIAKNDTKSNYVSGHSVSPIEQRWTENGRGPVLPVDVVSTYDEDNGQWYQLVDFDFDGVSGNYTWRKKVTRYQIRVLNLQLVVTGAGYAPANKAYVFFNYHWVETGFVSTPRTVSSPMTIIGSSGGWTIQNYDDEVPIYTSTSAVDTPDLCVWAATNNAYLPLPSFATNGSWVDFSPSVMPEKKDVVFNRSFQPSMYRNRGNWKEEAVLWNSLWDYAADTTYPTGHVLHFAGTQYKAIQETTGNLPSDADYWEITDDAPAYWVSLGYQAMYGNWETWFSKASKIQVTEDEIPTAWSDASNYYINDMVSRSDYVWRCKASGANINHTPTHGTSDAYWTHKTIFYEDDYLTMPAFNSSANYSPGTDVYTPPHTGHWHVYTANTLPVVNQTPSLSSVYWERLYAISAGSPVGGDDFGKFIGRTGASTCRYTPDHFGQKPLHWNYKINDSGEIGVAGTGNPAYLRDLTYEYVTPAYGYSVYDREVLLLKKYRVRREYIRWCGAFDGYEPGGAKAGLTPPEWESYGMLARYGDWNTNWVKASSTAGDNAGDLVGIASSVTVNRYQPTPQNIGLNWNYATTQSGEIGVAGTGNPAYLRDLTYGYVTPSYGYAIYNHPLVEAQVLTSSGEPEIDMDTGVQYSAVPYENPAFCVLGQRLVRYVKTQFSRLYLVVNPVLVKNLQIPTMDMVVAETNSNRSVAYKTTKVSEYLWAVEKTSIEFTEWKADLPEVDADGNVRNWPRVDQSGFYFLRHCPAAGTSFTGEDVATGKVMYPPVIFN